MQMTVVIYTIIGILTALWFCLYKIDTLPEMEEKPTWGFRLIILPATVLLWPVVIFQIKKRP
jgi:hypothetical protein